MLAEPHFVFETLGFGITPAMVLHPDASPQICEEMSSLKSIERYQIWHSVASDGALKCLPPDLRKYQRCAARWENGFLTSFSLVIKEGGSPFKMYWKCNPERDFHSHLKRVEFVFSCIDCVKLIWYLAPESHLQLSKSWGMDWIYKEKLSEVVDCK